MITSMGLAATGWSGTDGGGETIRGARNGSCVESPRGPIPHQGEVHIWTVDLDLPEGGLPPMRLWLSSEECLRAGRFCHDVDRRRYLAHKGALRQILGAYLGLQPGEIRFGQDRRGKPHLAGPFRDGLHFGVSHSGSMGLVGIRRGGHVGVDVERVVPGFDWREVANTALSEREVRALGALPADQQWNAFFAIWTRKEALAKAVGLGLRARLAFLEAPTDPGCVGWSRRSVETPGGQVHCSLVDLSLGFGFRGALALVGSSSDVRRFEWAAEDEPPTDGTLMADLSDVPTRKGEQRTPFAGGIGYCSNGTA